MLGPRNRPTSYQAEDTSRPSAEPDARMDAPKRAQRAGRNAELDHPDPAPG